MGYSGVFRETARIKINVPYTLCNIQHLTKLWPVDTYHYMRPFSIFGVPCAFFNNFTRSYCIFYANIVDFVQTASSVASDLDLVCFYIHFHEILTQLTAN